MPANSIRRKKTIRKGGHTFSTREPLPSIDNIRLMFSQFINTSRIELINRGGYGIILRAKAKPNKWSYHPPDSNYTRIIPGKNNREPVNQLIIKLCIIGDGDDFLIDSEDEDSSMGLVSETEFTDEVNYQTDIYLKTIKYMQALCPSIVYAEILNYTEAIDMLNQIFRVSGNIELHAILGTLGNVINNRPDLRVGIIGMEFAEEYTELRQLIEQEVDELDIIMNIARVALLELAVNTGYAHGDFHTGNIMIRRNTQEYFGDWFPYRAMIIDFGRTEKIPPNIMAKIKQKIEDKQYVAALSDMCRIKMSADVIDDIQYAPDLYGWACGNYNITGEDDGSFDTYFNQVILPNIQDQNEINDYKEHYKSLYQNLPDNIKYKTIQNNEYIGNMFLAREAQIDKLCKTMHTLHSSNEDKYPLLPLNNSFKNHIYYGILDTRPLSAKTRRSSSRPPSRSSSRSSSRSPSRPPSRSASRKHAWTDYSVDLPFHDD